VRAEARHQLKEDRFRGATIQVAESAAHWSVEHKSKLIVAAIVLVVVAAAVAGGWYYLNLQDEKASIDLNKAVRVLESPVGAPAQPVQPGQPTFANGKERATEAHKQFQAIVDKYPHTRTGDISRYFLGLTAVDMGDYAAAQKELSTVGSSRNKDLASLAKLALGSVYLKQNQAKQAIEVFKALADKPTNMVSKATAQLQLAGALLADMQPLEAKRIYEQVQKENPATPAAQIAAQELQQLK
jgi:TolA-binding protein